MGETLKTLAKASLPNQPIFPNRFVVEACEDFHFHYRNYRIRISFADWKPFAKGFSDAYERWVKQGEPFGSHTELCRKIVATNAFDDGVQVNLNKNLYKLAKGKIFSDGAEFFDDDTYIHLKHRDVRTEMSVDEFRTFSDVIIKARAELDSMQGVTLHNTGVHDAG